MSDDAPEGPGRGAWVNPKLLQSLYADLQHPDPIGPHTDWSDELGRQWRIRLDNRAVPKSDGSKNVELRLAADPGMNLLRRSLEDDLAHTLSHRVAAGLDRLRLRFSLLASEDIDVRAGLPLQQGGQAMGTPSAQVWIMGKLASLCQRTGGFLVVDEWRFGAGGEGLRRQALPMCTFDEEVYFISLPEAIRDRPDWRLIACSNTVPLFHGFVIRDMPMPAPSTALSRTQIDAMAARCCAIYIGIFDGESFLLGETVERPDAEVVTH
ncbi:MAG TPA: polymorphic toxin type 37 domain-containing protein [Myxococcota bacterium]|nr:polymorphic toxin type 37 domain-containing protein [Myxococcota bacterium]